MLTVQTFARDCRGRQFCGYSIPTSPLIIFKTCSRVFLWYNYSADCSQSILCNQNWTHLSRLGVHWKWINSSLRDSVYEKPSLLLIHLLSWLQQHNCIQNWHWNFCFNCKAEKNAQIFVIQLVHTRKFAKFRRAPGRLRNPSYGGGGNFQTAASKGCTLSQ